MVWKIREVKKVDLWGQRHIFQEITLPLMSPSWLSTPYCTSLREPITRVDVIISSEGGYQAGDNVVTGVLTPAEGKANVWPLASV